MNSKDTKLHNSSQEPDNNFHGAHLGPTWVLSAPGGPHVGPMNLAIRGTLTWPGSTTPLVAAVCYKCLHTVRNSIQNPPTEAEIWFTLCNRSLGQSFLKWSTSQYSYCSHLCLISEWFIKLSNSYQGLSWTFLHNCPKVDATRLHRWLVNIVLGQRVLRCHPVGLFQRYLSMVARIYTQHIGPTASNKYRLLL